MMNGDMYCSYAGTMGGEEGYYEEDAMGDGMESYDG